MTAAHCSQGVGKQEAVRGPGGGGQGTYTSEESLFEFACPFEGRKPILEF